MSCDPHSLPDGFTIKSESSGKSDLKQTKKVAHQHSFASWWFVNYSTFSDDKNGKYFVFRVSKYHEENIRLNAALFKVIERSLEKKSVQFSIVAFYNTVQWYIICIQPMPHWYKTSPVNGNNKSEFELKKQ